MEEVSSVIWPFLTRTRYGQLNVWRTVFLTALIVVSYSAAKNDTVWARRSGMVLSLSLLVVLSMSGHQGVKGYANIPFFLDVLHLVAISLWIGGLFLIRLCFSFFLRQAGVELLDTFKHLFKKFSDLATYCVGAVAVTGIILLLFTIKSFSILFGKPYGIVLIIKILLVCIILILGGINKFFIVPLLNAADKDKWNEIVVTRRRLYLLATVEVYLGLGVLLATSLLTHLSPEG
jgi:putative copper export protein